jgi:PleD family two-component response regulator
MAEEAPDLILMDVMMQEITGFELALQLKRNHEYKAIPIIFVTSLDQARDIERGFEVGGHDYVKKPFLTQELRARVRSALRLKNLEHDLRMRSVTDYLTGAYNRRYFFEAVNSNLSYAQRMRRNLCIAVLDIDFFKKINDEHRPRSRRRSARALHATRFATRFENTIFSHVWRRRICDSIFRLH